MSLTSVLLLTAVVPHRDSPVHGMVTNETATHTNRFCPIKNRLRRLPTRRETETGKKGRPNTVWGVRGDTKTITERYTVYKLHNAGNTFPYGRETCVKTDKNVSKNKTTETKYGGVRNEMLPRMHLPRYLENGTRSRLVRCSYSFSVQWGTAW
jgi:hypothetical protein